jgi:hypothetical protein
MINIKEILIDNTRIYVDIEHDKLLYPHRVIGMRHSNGLILLDSDKIAKYKALLKRYKSYLRGFVSKRGRFKDKICRDYYTYLRKVKEIKRYFRLLKAVRSILAARGVVII